MKVCFGFVCFLLSFHFGESEDVEATLLMLDSMVDMMVGYGQYDRVYYDKLRSCMASMDLSQPSASDAFWQGIIDYWDIGGAADDGWGETNLVYIENNMTVTNVHNMTIFEPCGYTSNVAYYHPATEICERFTRRGFALPDEIIQSYVRGFTNMAVGSSFMHGSHTNLGGQQDVDNLAVLAYQMHQANLAYIPRNPILHDISYTARNKTAFELITTFSDMFLSKPVEEWYSFTSQLDIPDYYLTYTAIFTTVLDVLFDNEFVDAIIPILAGPFGVSPDIVDFVQTAYLPELRHYTNQFNVTGIQRVRFMGNAIGTSAKLIFAFLWQEEVLTDSPILLSPKANEIGWAILPKFNEMVSRIQTYPYYEENFQIGEDIYPGDDWCNPVIPHAKWHLESAIGLLDLAYLSNDIYKFFEDIDP